MVFQVASGWCVNLVNLPESTLHGTAIYAAPDRPPKAPPLAVKLGSPSWQSQMAVVSGKIILTVNHDESTLSTWRHLEILDSWTMRGRWMLTRAACCSPINQTPSCICFRNQDKMIKTTTKVQPGNSRLHTPSPEILRHKKRIRSGSGAPGERPSRSKDLTILVPQPSFVHQPSHRAVHLASGAQVWHVHAGPGVVWHNKDRLGEGADRDGRHQIKRYEMHRKPEEIVVPPEPGRTYSIDSRSLHGKGQTLHSRCTMV